MDIKTSSKDLLLNKLGDVMSALEKDQYKLALVKMQVFMAKVKILEPKVINKEQFGFIMGESLDICIAIWEDAKINDPSLDDEKIKQIFKFIKSFIDTKDKADIYDDLIDKIEAISDMII